MRKERFLSKFGANDSNARKTPQDKQRLVYLLHEAIELFGDYHTQLSNTEDFAQWNLPDELGESWIAIRDMGIVNALHNSGVLPQEAIETVNRIIDRFDAAFQLPEDEQVQVYSHTAMQDSAFWKMQRQDAQTLIPILKEALGSIQA